MLQKPKEMGLKGLPRGYLKPQEKHQLLKTYIFLPSLRLILSKSDPLCYVILHGSCALELVSDYDKKQARH